MQGEQEIYFQALKPLWQERLPVEGFITMHNQLSKWTCRIYLNDTSFDHILISSKCFKCVYVEMCEGALWRTLSQKNLKLLHRQSLFFQLCLGIFTGTRRPVLV